MQMCVCVCKYMHLLFQTRDLLESEGGVYTHEVRHEECSHLIIRKPRGEKYEVAQRWDVSIVRPEWVTDTIERGYYQRGDEHRVADDDDGSGGHSAQTSQLPSTSAPQVAGAGVPGTAKSH